MISLLVCSRIEGNANSHLTDLLDSLAFATSDYKNFELLIKFDSDDPGVPDISRTLLEYPYKIKFIKDGRQRGYVDLHRFYNRLLPLVSPRATMLGAIADDFVFVVKGWDEIILSKQGIFEDDIFLIHGRFHPPYDRLDYLRNPFSLGFSLDDMEDLKIIDEAPFWSKSLINICGGFGQVSFTDAWTLALEHYLHHYFEINRTIFLQEPVIYRRTLDEIDQPGGERWWAARADNFALMRTAEYRETVKKQAKDIHRTIWEMASNGI